jgi:hypothetical protein
VISWSQAFAFKVNLCRYAAVDLVSPSELEDVVGGRSGSGGVPIYAYIRPRCSAAGCI